MLPFFSSAVSTLGMVAIGGVNLEAVAMYGLVALVIGLIAWSKYNEPPLSDPYAKKKLDYERPQRTGDADLGPAVAVPIVGTHAAAPEQP